MKVRKKYQVMGQVFETVESAETFLSKLSIEEVFCANKLVFYSKEDAQKEALAAKITGVFCHWGRDKGIIDVARRAVNLMDVQYRGLQVGDYCLDCDCGGEMREGEADGGCSCHNDPPCSYCTTEVLECNECGKRFVTKEGEVIEDDFEEGQ